MLSQVICRPTSPLLTLTDIRPGSIAPEGVLMGIACVCAPTAVRDCYRD